MNESGHTPTASRDLTHATPPPPDLEPDFSAIIAELEAAAPPRELVAAEQREYERMHRTYSGEYVAYRDSWEPPVFRRDVVAHAPSLKAVHDVLDLLPAAEREQYAVTYCESASEARAFRVGYAVATIRSGADSTDLAPSPPQDHP